MTSRVVSVIGAGGGCGKLACQQLAAAGTSVRAIVRNPDKYSGVFDDAVDVRKGDVSDVGSLRTALEGTTHCLFAASAKRYFSAGAVDRDGAGAVAAVCKELGVAHLVVISSGLVAPSQRWHPIRILLNHFVWGLMDAKFAGEEIVRGSGQPYTIIRPGGLADTPMLCSTRPIIMAQNRSAAVPESERQISRSDVVAICLAAFDEAKARNATVEVGVAKVDDASAAAAAGISFDGVHPDDLSAAEI